MNRSATTFLALSLAAPLSMMLSGCESDFIPDCAHPNRAVQSPMESNDASSEARGGGGPGEEGVPLVSVGFPNHPGEQPQVRTAADNINDTFNPPSTEPTPIPSGPSTSQPSIHIDPIHGAGE